MAATRVLVTAGLGDLFPAALEDFFWGGGGIRDMAVEAGETAAGRGS